MTEVSYAPGGWTAVAAGRCWMLIDAAPNSVAIAEIWRWAETASGFDALIASMLDLGLDRIPAFAMLAADDAAYRLICRGHGNATVIGPTGTEHVDGAGLATWREQLVPSGTERVVLGAPSAETDLRLPCSSGVFLATSVTVTFAAGPPGPLAPPPLVPVPRVPVPRVPVPRVPVPRVPVPPVPVPPVPVPPGPVPPGPVPPGRPGRASASPAWPERRHHRL